MVQDSGSYIKFGENNYELRFIFFHTPSNHIIDGKSASMEINFYHGIMEDMDIKRVEELTNAMLNDDFPVNCLHSNMSKQEREKNYDQFRKGKSRVLISSNVTARGIDIQQVSVVINFDVPRCVHNYLHRIGRSGRWGRKGLAINFVTKEDIGAMKAIENHYQSTIEELPSNFSSLV